VNLKMVGAYVLLSLLLGLIPGVIASRKGQPFLGWWIYGALLIVIALPHAIILKRKPEVDGERST